jgi:hypothetical protein
MAMNDDEGPTGGPAPPANRWRQWRRLAPGLLIVALLALPTGWVVRGRMIDGRPIASTGLGGRGLFGDDAPGSEPPEIAASEPVDPDEFLDPDLLAAVPVGPEDVADPVRAILSDAPLIDALDDSGIPAVARDAYDEAELALATEDPSCGVRWSLLAAIGRVESDHGRFGGARLDGNGDTSPEIRGIPLDGRPNVALIRDTDRGELDGDTTFDRAVGPMQIIPTTWRSIASDGNGDGRRDPDNIYDAAQSAARYLCAGNEDLRRLDGRRRAVRRYNNADEYGRMVEHLATMYEAGDLGAVREAIARDVGFDEDQLPLDPFPVFNPPPWMPEPAPPAVPEPAPAPAPPPAAAIGWAPATRLVVVTILNAQQEKAKEAEDQPSTTTTTTTTPGPTCPSARPAPSTAATSTSTTKSAYPTTRTTGDGSADKPCPAPPPTTSAPPDGDGRR